eukprot:12938119-Prorocentrum_lima.AAC.1
MAPNGYSDSEVTNFLDTWWVPLVSEDRARALAQYENQADNSDDASDENVPVSSPKPATQKGD